jgi:hypothetical protein
MAGPQASPATCSGLDAAASAVRAILACGLDGQSPVAGPQRPHPRAVIADHLLAAAGRHSSRRAKAKGVVMLTDFYLAFATVCFTLLGLWIVVQTRHAEWCQVALQQRRAYGVALHFSLPGADEPAVADRSRQHGPCGGSPLRSSPAVAPSSLFWCAVLGPAGSAWLPTWWPSSCTC